MWCQGQHGRSLHQGARPLSVIGDSTAAKLHPLGGMEDQGLLPTSARGFIISVYSLPWRRLPQGAAGKSKLKESCPLWRQGRNRRPLQYSKTDNHALLVRFNLCVAWRWQHSQAPRARRYGGEGVCWRRRHVHQRGRDFSSTTAGKPQKQPSRTPSDIEYLYSSISLIGYLVYSAQQ